MRTAEFCRKAVNKHFQRVIIELNDGSYEKTWIFQINYCLP